MGNVIRFDENTPIDEWICMSNLTTDVFINVLSLSGSALAVTVEEKQLVVWLSEKDQKFVGLGTVGFDIVEMPWKKETFSNDKKFLINVIKSAEHKLGWEKLNYIPDFILPDLQKFKEYIERMTENDVDNNAIREWLDASERTDPINCGFPRCKKHNTLLTIFGCEICSCET